MIIVKQLNEDNVKLYKDGRLIFDSLHPRHEWVLTYSELNDKERKSRIEEIESLYY